MSFSVHIQACRALMIIALILGLVSIIVSTMGMKCINIGSRSDQSKGKFAMSGGILFLLAGKHNMNVYWQTISITMYSCLIYLILNYYVKFFPTGLCTIVATAWYASRVIADFNNPLFGGIRWEESHSVCHFQHSGRGLWLDSNVN